jgi:hypothetical protein
MLTARLRRAAGVYRRGDWFVLLVCTGLLIWLFLSLNSLQSTSPSPTAPVEPALQLDVPYPIASDKARLQVIFGVSSCSNPVVRVLVALTPPPPSQYRGWQLGSSPILFLTNDLTARTFRVFYYSSNSYNINDKNQASLFFRDSNQQGVVERVRPSAGHLVGNQYDGFRGVYASPDLGVRSSLSSLVVSFDADLILRRAYGSCYLEIPAIYEVGVIATPGSVKGAWPDLQWPHEDFWLNTLVNSFQITNWNLNLAQPLALSIDLSDSTPRLSANGVETWTCLAKSGENCAGGYVALLAPNAAGGLNEEILWRGTLLGVAASLFAASLLRFRARALRARTKRDSEESAPGTPAN